MLTPEKFADAISKGLGRAVLAVDGPVNEEFQQIIIHACLTDQRCDPQTEDERTDYLMLLAERAQIIENLLPIVKDSVDPAIDDWDQLQRLRMLRQFAKRGDQDCIERLKAYSLDGNMHAVDCLEDLDELEWLVENVLPIFPEDEKYRAVFWRLDKLVERSSAYNKLKEFQIENEKKRGQYREPLALTFEEAMAKISEGELYSANLLRLASPLTRHQVEQVASLWLIEDDHRKGRAYAKIFEKYDYPFEVETIISLVDNEEGPFCYEDVLANINHSSVRELGLRLLALSEPDSVGYTCLTSSYEPKDIPIMLTALDRFDKEDSNGIHLLVIQIRDLIEDMEAEVRLPFLVWVYENTTCAFCRWAVAEKLVEDGTLPDAYREELKFDVCEGTREMVAE